MNIIERLVSVIAPHVCIGCGVEEDALLCETCRQGQPLVPSRCYRCKAVTEEYTVCRNCRDTTPLRQVVVYTHYQAEAKELLHRTKYERAKSGTEEMAVMMAEIAWVFNQTSLLVHIPTATSRVRARGYDHAKLLTSALSHRTGLRRASLLARVGQAHQVGANRSARLKQLEAAFRAIRMSAVRGRHIVLVDDVLTTGATLETAARVLRRAGAASVSAIVFAQA